MIGKLLRAAILVAGGLAVSGNSGCTPKTATPAKKPAAPDYQAAVPPSPPAANIRAICYNEADLATMRARMLHQELTVATLQCQNSSGSLYQLPRQVHRRTRRQRPGADADRRAPPPQRRRRGDRIRQSHRAEGAGRSGVLLAQPARSRMVARSQGHQPRAGAAALRSGAGHEHLSLPGQVGAFQMC